MEKNATITRRPRALVVGLDRAIAAAPTLLSHAGFEVTLITPQPELRWCKNVARLVRVPKGDVLPRGIAEMRQGDYAMIVVGDDEMLRRLRDSDLSEAEKVRFLPISDVRGLGHIASKIGLSRALEAGGVLTPAYGAAADENEVRRCAKQLGYPVMVKSDFGAGGSQVTRLDGPEDPLGNLAYPVLVQRVIEGDLIDCSGFFRRGELVAFSYSECIVAMRDGVGPSIVRRYRTRPEEDAGLVAALQALGRALDADGFANVSAMRAHEDGRHHFFEADMRPNAWIDFPRHFGNDPAVAIAAAFGLPKVEPRPFATPVPAHMVLAYLPRLKLWEALTNRYHCQRHFDDYWQRGIVYDRLARQVARLTPRRVANKLRRMLGLAV